jgi:succinate-acetate transporter protein
MFCLLDFQGSSAASLVSISGTWYFFGGIAMVVAGILEFILGNTYPFVVFIIYGVHWVQAGYTGDPAHPLSAAYGVGAVGANSPEYLAGQGIYNLVMLLVTFIFLLGSVRTNVPFVIVFFTLIFIFGFFAAAQFKLAAGDVVTGLRYFKVAGGFGFVTLMMGW